MKNKLYQLTGARGNTSFYERYILGAYVVLVDDFYLGKHHYVYPSKAYHINHLMGLNTGKKAREIHR